MCKLSKLTWTGITCIVVALCFVFGFVAWVRAKYTKPISIPITAVAGHFRTPEFTVNLDHEYTIGIEAKESFRERQPLPFDQLNCLMGIRSYVNQPVFSVIIPQAKDCGNLPGIVAKWALTTDGQVVSQGSSSDSDFGIFDEDKITRVIGAFNGGEGARYILDIDFGTDNTSLTPTDPRLVVHVSSDAYEQNLLLTVVGFVVVVCAVFVVSGIMLLLLAALRNWRKWRRSRVTPVIDPTPSGLGLS